MDKTVIKNYFVPFLLGDCRASFFLSLRIYRKTGIISYVCDKKMCGANFINPLFKFVRIVSVQNGTLLLEQFTYLSSAFSNSLPILIPCNGEYKAFLDKHKTFLEDYFIISDKNSVFGIFSGKK